MSVPADNTPFTVFVARPNTDAYVRSAEPTAQPRKGEIDPTFLDAMTVRHKVFIVEQKVPLECELDEDDPRSCHWVAHMSDGGDNTSVISQQAVGCIRAVPYPQSPHPIPGAAYTIIDGVNEIKGRWVRKADAGSNGETPKLPLSPPTSTTPQSALEFIPASADDTPAAAGSAGGAGGADRATSLHDGKEPYIKLGRIAVLPYFRGFRLGQYLVQTTLDWIKANPTFFDEHDPEAAAATAETKFNGLVCVHAQVHALGFYTRLGFAVDEGMGTWWEEGIPHVGMFLRLDLNKKE
ncbi:hypothetical protein SCUCBS95973_001663 [Sporothrix curviconia]|uniref:N-acetyltransferase domain-containing protein n=1 Tax=Sporothrix curviconia TaxID=1260050 RepID=A0ABP0B0G3_9PEZI